MSGLALSARSGRRLGGSRKYDLYLRRALFAWLMVFVIGGIIMILGPFTGEHTSGYLLGYLGVSVGLGIVLFIISPKRKRTTARRLIIFLLGMLLLLLAITTDHGNMQLEGLFFGALISLTHFAVIHYAIAKIIGPLVFGRVWCGWACWYAALFDQMPFKRSHGRINGRWGWLRYVHFALSMGLVLVFWFGYGYRDGVDGLSGLYWFLTGFLLYLLLGFILAVILKDNRAFCKYACPITVLLKASS
ncbi:MAG: 4Fe-4S binding protein, partial [Chloroflexi bacterium]|nr:4Fe-4S binding protein [Chloroflexota bacterium]